MHCDAVICRVIFFNDTATTEIYTLSLHDALPISPKPPCSPAPPARGRAPAGSPRPAANPSPPPTRRGRSEEHTSELQSRQYLVCRLLLEKKNNVATYMPRSCVDNQYLHHGRPSPG